MLQSKNYLNRILIIFILITIVILALATWQYYSTNKSHDIEFYKLFLDFVKNVLIGFLIAVLGILIPQMIPFKRFDLEVSKKAKEIYSEAKTEMECFAYKFQYMDDVNKILQFLQEVQQKKHLADVYHEYLPNVNPEGKYPAQRIWPKDLKPYNRITNIRNIVQENSSDWKELSPDKRFKIINEVVDVLKANDDNKKMKIQKYNDGVG